MDDYIRIFYILESGNRPVGSNISLAGGNDMRARDAKKNVNGFS